MIMMMLIMMMMMMMKTYFVSLSLWKGDGGCNNLYKSPKETRCEKAATRHGAANSPFLGRWHWPYGH